MYLHYEITLNLSVCEQ